MTGARHLHECGARQRNPNRLALAAVDAVVPEGSAVDALRRDSRQAVRARAVAVGEGRDHKVAPGESVNVGADLLDDTSELVADRTKLVRGFSAVVPEVRAADAAHDDAHHGIGGLDDNRVWSVADLDPAWPVEDGCSHVAPRLILRIGLAATIQPPLVARAHLRARVTIRTRPSLRPSTSASCGIVPSQRR